MRNLKLYSASKTAVEVRSDFNRCCLSNDIIYLFSDYNIIEILGETTRLLCNLQETTQNDLTNIPVYMDCSIITNRLVVCMSKGDILAIDVDNAAVELVGNIEPGIAQAAWSPNVEILAVVTTNGNLILLSQDFDPLHEIELGLTGIEEHVSVGWGSKETQFRGSEGKLKSGIAVELSCDKYDDGGVRVSWLGDSNCLVVSFLRDNLRHLKVCSSDGTLLYSSEGMPRLESALAWRPNGPFIASSEKFPNKRMISFFEKNLLPHGGFRIGDDCIVKEMFWNCDSSILGVYITAPNPLIKLYTVGNYHWYEKFTIKLEQLENMLLAEWDKYDSQTLHLVTSSEATIFHSRWSWRWCVDCSKGDSEGDAATVAVVDGNNLLLTQFQKCVIPPPLSAAVINLNESISAVEFLQDENDQFSSNDFIVQTVDNVIHFYRYDNNKMTYSLAFKTEGFKNLLFCPSWVTPKCVLSCSLKVNGQYELLCFTYDLSNPSESLVAKSIPLPNPVVIIRYLPKTNTALLWDSQQNPKVVHLDSLAVVDSSLSCGPKNGKILGAEVRENIFVLDSSHRLRADDELIASNVTSFRVVKDHLLVTTMQHKLLCWPLGDLKSVACERPVERGARIVTVVSDTSNVVLQLPRGNLEVVRPRALTIARLKGYLNDLKFGLAMKIMRVERVNLNLFFDHCPDLFTSNISTFINDVTDTTHLCTFIAELSVENVTQTLYSPFYAKSESCFRDKINTICSAMLLNFNGRENREKFLLPILSCLIKMGNVDEALILVQKKLQAEKEGVKNSVTSSDGLAHILYLVDVEQLFKIALGTYDLNLVMFIASKSQKDPKEYLPFLSHLKNMEENYQKFTIDNFLKRYQKALGHLVLCPDKSKECLDYVMKHNLFRSALRIFAPNTDNWKAVCVAYGIELTRKSHHEEAGLIMQRAEEYILAQHAFSRAGAWRQQISCAKLAGLSDDQLKLLYNSIADSLLTSRRYSEAARLFIDYKKDIELGVTALCDAHSFQEAIATAEINQRMDLICSLVKPAATAACSTYEQIICEANESFERQLTRLKEVQRARLDFGGVDWDDSASESSQGSSRASASSRASSTRSAKNARKLERNLMKKGGPFEEVALIAALHDTATQMAKLKSQIRTINLTLISLNEDGIAFHLQKSFCKVLERLKNVIPEIWQKPSDNSLQTATSNSLAASFNTGARVFPAPVQALQPKVLFAPDLCNSVEWQLEIVVDE